MRKKLLFPAAACGLCFLLLSGFDQQMTPEEILEKSNEASAAIEEVSADLTLNLEAGVSSESRTEGEQSFLLGIYGDLNVAMQTQNTPGEDTPSVNCKVAGDIRTSVPGSEESARMEYYLLTDGDGSLDAYVNVSEDEEDHWQHESLPTDSLTEGMGSALPQVTTLPGTRTLSDTFTEVDGISCYQVTNTITYEDLEPYLTDLKELLSKQLPGEDLESAFSLVELALDGVRLNIVTDIGTEDFLVRKVRMDLSGSDLSGLCSILTYAFAQSGDDGMDLPEFAIDISNLYLEYVYDYDTPVEITVPEEALLAERNSQYAAS